MFKPDEATLKMALDLRAKKRANYYVEYCANDRRTIEMTAGSYGVAFEGRSTHEVVCDLVDVKWPEINVSELFAPKEPSDVYSDPNKFSDTVFAQGATADDIHRYRDVAGNAQPDRSSSPIYVGHRGSNGEVVPLDLDGTAKVSGFGPNGEQASFQLVSVSHLFDGEYVKEFLFALYAAMAEESYAEVTDRVIAFLNEQRWLDEAEDYRRNHAAPEPMPEGGFPVAAVDGLPSWADLTGPREALIETRPESLADVDTTQVLDTGEINQYKPGPY